MGQFFTQPTHVSHLQEREEEILLSKLSKTLFGGQNQQSCYSFYCLVNRGAGHLIIKLSSRKEANERNIIFTNEKLERKKRNFANTLESKLTRYFEI